MIIQFNDSLNNLIKKSGIYKILCLSNKKFYIGRANNLSIRIRTHKSKLRNNNHENPYLQNAYNKYGENNFIFIIVEYTKDLVNREQYYLDITNCYNPSIGFNSSKFAETGCNNLGKKMSEEQKSKISKSCLKSPKMKERNRASKETRSIASTKSQGRVYNFLSPENEIITGKGLAIMARKYNLKRECLTKLISGKILSYKNWINYDTYKNIKTVKLLSPNNIIFEIFESDLTEFCKYYNLNSQNFCALRHGRTKHINGWSLFKKPLKKFYLYNKDKKYIIYSGIFSKISKQVNLSETTLSRLIKKEKEEYLGWRVKECQI